MEIEGSGTDITLTGKIGPCHLIWNNFFVTISVHGELIWVIMDLFYKVAIDKFTKVMAEHIACNNLSSLITFMYLYFLIQYLITYMNDLI